MSTHSLFCVGTRADIKYTTWPRAACPHVAPRHCRPHLRIGAYCRTCTCI